MHGPQTAWMLYVSTASWLCAIKIDGKCFASPSEASTLLFFPHRPDRQSFFDDAGLYVYNYWQVNDDSIVLDATFVIANWLHEPFDEQVSERRTKKKKNDLAGNAMNTELLLSQQAWVHLNHLTSSWVTQTRRPRWRDYAIEALCCDLISPAEYCWQTPH